MRRGPVVLLALLAAVLVLAGCAGAPAAVDAPRGAGVQVDTPALRAAKQQAGIPGCTTGTAPVVTDGLPDQALPCLGGGTAVNLATLRGPLVVNTWASWCGPCRKELPLYAAYARKHAGSVKVVGVDFQDVQPAAAIELAATSKVAYPLVADPDGVMHSRLLPSLALVDARGKVVYRANVEITSLAQLESLVAAHLGVRG